ncbi:helix-turn-helix domain-containing protein [Aquisphaera giovannonii]|uniref:helix-turn-helix domain-containing protein n=1 Tax=Aquisphaera giovannonii TaxID=406548 RepID=UPI00143CEFF9
MSGPRHLTREQLEERRLEAGRLLRDDWFSQAEIVRRLDVSRAAASQWAKRLREGTHGRAALRRRARSGRPARLTDQQWREFLNVLPRGTREAGSQTERWILPKIRVVI